MSRFFRVLAGRVWLTCGCKTIGRRYVDRSACCVHGGRQPSLREPTMTPVPALPAADGWVREFGAAA